MIWVARMKDGEIIRKYDCGRERSSADLDRACLESFRITETGGETAARFSSDSGIIGFTNLDYEKVAALQGGETLTFVFDKEKERFKMDRASWAFYNSMAFQDERDYFYIEFDQTGCISIGGRVFYMGFVSADGKEMPFTHQPPYNDFKYIVHRNEDLYMNLKTTLKKTDYVTAHSLHLTKKHVFDDIEFDVAYEIRFDIIKGCVLLDCILSSNLSLTGSLFMFFENSRTANPIQLHRHEKKQIKKILTLV